MKPINPTDFAVFTVAITLMLAGIYIICHITATAIAEHEAKRRLRRQLQDHDAWLAGWGVNRPRRLVPRRKEGTNTNHKS